MYGKSPHGYDIFALMLKHGTGKIKIYFKRKPRYTFLQRVISGMNMMTTKFSVSPSYFDTMMVSDDVEEAKNYWMKS